MRKRALWTVMATLAFMIGGTLLLACGIGYYVYSWLHVDPIVLASDAGEDDCLAAVDRWLDEQFDKNKFNGGVLLVRNGEVLLSKTCGFTDQTASARLDDHSAFRLASVSKQFTAAAILRLAELDLLELDDQVAKHIDGFTFENVSIRHLLNQTSGIPDEYLELAETHRATVGDVLTISKAVELVTRHSVAEQTPGESMQYSNTNYILLAGIVETVSNAPFEQFMQDEIFRPLGMNDTRVWNLLSENRSPNQTSDFDQVDDDRTAVEPTWVDGVAGDGAVFSSLNDFVIWDQFWNGNDLVSEDLLREATKRPRLNDGTESDYGFGWVVERNRHWHNGAWLGANTYIVRYPNSGCCLVILDNSSNIRMDKIANRIEKAFDAILRGDG